MQKTLLVAKHEFKYMLRAPLAWTLMGVVLLVLAWAFLAKVEDFQQIAHELQNFPKSPGVTGFVIMSLYSTSSIILMMIIPLLAMNSFHRERWDGKMTLLFSAPLKSSEIVFGKFIGLSVYLALMVFLISLMPLSLLFASPVDVTTILLSALGLWLLLISFSAITLFLACVTKEPVITLSLSIGVLLFLWLIDWSSQSALSENSLVRYISVMKHYENILRTKISTTDLIYFVSLIGLFLSLSIHHLNQKKENV